MIAAIYRKCVTHWVGPRQIHVGFQGQFVTYLKC